MQNLSQSSPQEASLHGSKFVDDCRDISKASYSPHAANRNEASRNPMNSNNADADDDDDDVLTTESDRRAAPDGTAGEKGA